MMVASRVMIALMAFLIFPALGSSGWAQTNRSADSGLEHAPPRGNQGEGPFERLIIRGVNVIDGTGAPIQGPMDVVIERNRIAEVRSVGAPGVPIKEERRPGNATKEMDAQGMFLLPGLVDLMGHVRVAPVMPAEYIYKLWMGHGVTTVLDPGAPRGVDWMLRARQRSANNEMVAPRIFFYSRPGAGWDGGPILTPEKAREYVRWAAEKGIDGLKLGSYEPEIMAALIDEAKQHGMGSKAHLGQTGVAQMNALDAARLGLTSLEHWYGLPEALFDDRSVQHYPFDYNYNNEYDRFGQAGRLWKQAAKPGSEKWNAVMNEFLELGFFLNPTLTIYQASRDVMRERNADWHHTYTIQALWDFFTPSRERHGSYWYSWTTQDELEWKHNFDLWFAFLNEYKNRGGRVTTGTDAGRIYDLFGFSHIQELELLQEAGFHPLEVIRSATMYSAAAIFEPKGKGPEFGVIKPGMLADMMIVELNPLQDFKVLYGTGTLRLDDETGEVKRVGGVKYTIKDGIIYDAKELLADVARMVAQSKATGRPTDSGSR